ncbi:MAG: hypothetical protein CVU05_01520 [Bacteroidetes bacterium HGW-Bacteroidetes-21]|jgi:hypothetical protein|nr:MAG: hypothetical protein CVU05_01520 [Bacteroidetes bacterium HGW-Bacteroidetes-21]
MIKRIIVSLFIFNLFNSVSAQQWGLYTLYSERFTKKVYLVDTADVPNVFKSWNFSEVNGYSCYMIPGDTLVRSVSYGLFEIMGGAAHNGKIQKILWDGTIVWDYIYSSSTFGSHHDMCPLPNGNVLLISFDVKSLAEAIQAGASVSSAVLSEKIVEIKPTGPTSGIVVWEWKLWDHLCQNHNSSKDNFVNSIIDNPQLMNLNYGTGYDRWHMNGIDYNAEKDQIAFSLNRMGEFYVIDHSTTTSEAAGHAGGISGKGGDFLYRWGNPAVYGATGNAVFNQVHDARWTSEDYLPCPDCLVGYNNTGGPGGNTCIDIIVPPVDGNVYTPMAGSPASYFLRQTTDFVAPTMGNSQQLPNGNMLICNTGANIYEVDIDGNILWSRTANAAQGLRYDKCYIRGPVVDVISSSAIICAGSEVTLEAAANSPTESNPVYSYLWSTGSADQSQTLTPAETEVYYVTVTNTALGCSNTDSILITVFQTPEANAGNDILLTYGNSAQLTASGGGSYLWNTGDTTSIITITPAWNSTYSVTVTSSGGCTDSDDLLVTVTGGVLSVQASASPSVICAGDSVQLGAMATGNTGLDWMWSSDVGGFTSNIENPIVAPLVSTLYSVSVTSGPTTAFSSVFVEVNPLPVSPEISQSGNILTSTPANLYQWYFNGTILLGDTVQNLTPLQEGNYQVMIKDDNGCTAMSSLYSFIFVEVPFVNITSKYIVCPNPTKGIFVITSPFNVVEYYKVIVTDVYGKIVSETNGKETVNISCCPDGLYFVRLVFVDHEEVLKVNLTR